nr:hypothetical protein [FCB group bacterium]
MENLSKILTGLSHYTYYDQPPFTVKFALSELSGHTPLIEEIRKIAEEKNETTQGRIAAAHKIIFEVHEMPSLQFTPFTKVEKNDIHAYIHYETALFYRNVHDYAASLNHLKIAKLMVECPDIELLIDYQFATVDAETKSSTDQLLNFARIFNQKKMPVMEIMAQFRIGEILASNSDFTGSRKVFTDVQDLIRAIPSQNLLITAISNLGFVYYLE